MQYFPREIVKMILSSVNSFECVSVCSLWCNIIEQDLIAEIVLDNEEGDVSAAIDRALTYNKNVVALDLCKMSTDSEESDYALLDVCLRGTLQMAKVLLELQDGAAADPNTQEGLALENAASVGNYDIAKLLISSGVRADCHNGSALVISARNGHFDIVKMLIEDPNNPPHNIYATSINFTTLNGHHAIFQLLMDEYIRISHIFIDYILEESLSNAAMYGYIIIVKMLLEKYEVRADCSYGSALINASSFGYTEIVNILLSAPKYPARANSGNGYALIGAATNGHLEIVEILLSAPKYAARANSSNSIALMHAVDNGHKDVAYVLMTAQKNPARADTDIPSQKILSKAVRRGDMEMIEILLSAGLYPARADSGDAMNEAAICGNIYVLKRLLEDPRNPASANGDVARRALYNAASCGRRRAVQLIIASNYPSSDRTYEKKALIQAARKGYYNIVKVLLDTNWINNKTRAQKKFIHDSIGEVENNGHVNVAKLMRDFIK